MSTLTIPQPTVPASAPSGFHYLERALDAECRLVLEAELAQLERQLAAFDSIEAPTLAESTAARSAVTRAVQIDNQINHDAQRPTWREVMLAHAESWEAQARAAEIEGRACRADAQVRRRLCEQQARDCHGMALSFRTHAEQGI